MQGLQETLADLQVETYVRYICKEAKLPSGQPMSFKTCERNVNALADYRQDLIAKGFLKESEVRTSCTFQQVSSSPFHALTCEGHRSLEAHNRTELFEWKIPRREVRSVRECALHALA